MTYIRYALLGIMVLLAVTVALANYQSVTLALWPDTITAFVGFGFSVTLPLFIIVGLAVGLGLVLGLIWEWVRERRFRAEVARLRQALAQAQAQNQARNQAGQQVADTAPAAQTGRGRQAPQEDVLAILEEDRAAR